MQSTRQLIPLSPARQSDLPIRREARSSSRIEVADIGVGADFAAAARHSKRVRILRVALPAIAVLAVAGYFLATRLQSAIDAIPIDFDDIEVTAEAVVIERPRLTGYQAGGEAYEVTAERAIHQNDNPDFLTLENVQAMIQLPGGATAWFAAPAGEYDTRASMMRLTGGLLMTIDTGIEATLDEITVDVANGVIRSARPFELEAANVTIRGNNLEMTPNSVRIGGRVETVFAMSGLRPGLGAGN